ncbi:MAG: hypothetical protein N2450_07635 [bacterium]|nr:hypothetical protein [bacterium]
MNKLIFILLIGLFTFVGCKGKSEFKPVKEETSQTNPTKDPHEGLGIPSPEELRKNAPSDPSSMIPPPPQTPTEGGLDLAALEKNVPAGITKTQATSSMRIGQYTLKRQSGDNEDGELAVFYFGSNAGSIQANIDRWFNQFINRKEENTSSFTTDTKLKVTVAEAKGDIQAAATMGGLSQDKPNWRLYGAIIETPAGPYFFKAVGPDKTIKYYRNILKSWLSKAKLVQSTANK